MKNILRNGLLALTALTAISFTAVSCSDDKTDEAGKVRVTGVSLDRTTLIVSPGQGETLVAIIAPENASNQNLLWSSSSTRATVDDQGVVTGVGEGTATITVTTRDGGYTATCEVTVIPAEVTGVTLNKENLDLIIGSSETLAANVLPETASIRDVTWKSADTSVATVDADGKVTAISLGTTVITATTVEGGKTAECSVKVKDEWTVYAVGMEADYGVALARVWKDGELLYELTDGEWFGYADAVYVTDNDDVYVSGYEAREMGSNVAFVWKNGEILYQLTDGTRLGFAPGIAVSGDDVYVAGYHNVLYGPSIGYVWKNGEVLYEFGDDQSIVVCSDIYVEGNDVYVAGYEYFNSQEPYTKYAKYWKNGQEVILNPEGVEGEATGIFLHGGDVYVTGRSAHPQTRYITGVVWKNGVANYVSEQAVTTVTYKTAMCNGTLYSAGWGSHESGINVGMVWRDYKTRMVYETDFISTFHDIKSAGNDIFVGGNKRISTNPAEDYNYARIWKNGELMYTILPEEYSYTDIHGIFIK